MAASTGNNTTPFFGCKISLISKSEIRYEGILYTIDPKESTIALAKVRSFGSEDRPVERPVPPRDDIFEFIIFRASDIKDLIVDDPPPAPHVPSLADPAIITAQHSATSTSFPAAFPAASSSGSGAGASSTSQPSALQQLQQQPQKASGQAGKQQSGERHSQSESKGAAPKQPSSSTVTSGQAFAKVAAGLGGGGAGGSTRPSQQQKAPGQRQPSLSFSNKQQQSKQGGDQNQAASGSGNQRNQQSGQHQLTTGHRDGQGGQNGFMGPRQHRQQNNQQNRVIGENANPNFHRNNNGQQQHQGFRSYNANRFVPRNQQSGGFVPGGQFGFGRGGYNNGPRGMGHRNFIPRGPMGAHPAGPKFPPLPDGDFDFEKAQADFKVLEEKLMSLRINGTLPSSSEGGDAPAELPEVPGIPASALTVAALEEEDISKEPCYNKTKSFFDSISCEALEREKGSNQRIDWKAERKQNRETFGVVAARRPTFYRNNRGGLGGGFHHHGGRGGYHQQRGHFQNRTGGPMNRVLRTPNSNGPNPNAPTNAVTSTTPLGGRSAASGSAAGGSAQAPKTPNGVGSSPVAVKN